MLNFDSLNACFSLDVAHTKRIQELNEEFQLRRSKMADKLASAVKKKEEELNAEIQTLDKVSLVLNQFPGACQI